MAKKQRNSPERVEMLAARYVEQRSRRGTTMLGLPAWKNRWTGKPHEHNRKRARRLAS